MGVMQIMTVYLVQQAVVSELHISSAPNLPNVFLIDITNDEIDGIRTLLIAQPGVTAPPSCSPSSPRASSPSTAFPPAR
jgi:putative ABC transport system permease protein